MCLYLPLNAVDFAESKYRVEDVSEVSSNVETPLMYRLKNARRVKYATQLIAMSMEKLGARRIERDAEDYYVPYETMNALMNKGLIIREYKLERQKTVENHPSKYYVGTGKHQVPQKLNL